MNYPKTLKKNLIAVPGRCDAKIGEGVIAHNPNLLCTAIQLLYYIILYKAFYMVNVTYY